MGSEVSLVVSVVAVVNGGASRADIPLITRMIAAVFVAWE
jgi:hypothetical protein